MFRVGLITLTVFIAKSSLATAAIAGLNDTVYCAKDLCVGEVKHIACGHSGTFDSSCPADRILVNLTRDDIDQLLELHNNYRNLVASGGQTGLSGATKMKTMKWNDELSFLASLNVMQCKMAHDGCRSTVDFKYAGQNLAITGNSAEFDTVTSALKTAVDGWFNEVADANQAAIDTCCTAAEGKTIGHFTQLVTDESGEVGCAVTQYTSDGFKFNLVACNYAITNMVGSPVYAAGAAASACANGTNPKFTSLCM